MFMLTFGVCRWPSGWSSTRIECAEKSRSASGCDKLALDGMKWQGVRVAVAEVRATFSP